MNVIPGSPRDLELALRAEGFSRRVSEWAVGRVRRYPFADRLPRNLALRLARRAARRIQQGGT